MRITKRHQGIRRLRRDITHIQLTFEYDHRCRDFVYDRISQPPLLRKNLNRLLTMKDLKIITDIPDGLEIATETLEIVLRILNDYRKRHGCFEQCLICQKDTCKCAKRYQINEEMNRIIE